MGTEATIILTHCPRHWDTAPLGEGLLFKFDFQKLFSLKARSDHQLAFLEATVSGQCFTACTGSHEKTMKKLLGVFLS